LATFEWATDRRIVEHFDLTTGTSTGRIIAIGLAMGAEADEICHCHEKQRAAISPSRQIRSRNSSLVSIPAR
jgi:patatin-like phospholipase/acyl hydrolase